MDIDDHALRSSRRSRRPRFLPPHPLLTPRRTINSTLPAPPRQRRSRPERGTHNRKVQYSRTCSHDGAADRAAGRGLLQAGHKSGVELMEHGVSGG